MTFMSTVMHAFDIRGRALHFYSSAFLGTVLGLASVLGVSSLTPLPLVAPGLEAPTPAVGAEELTPAEPEPEQDDGVFGAPQSALGLALAERFGDGVEFFNSSGARIQEPNRGDSVVMVHNADAPQTSGELTMVEADGQDFWVIIDEDNVLSGMTAHILRTEHEPVWPLPEGPVDAGPPENTLGVALQERFGAGVRFLHTRTPETGIRMVDGTPLTFDPSLPGVEAFTASPEPGDRLTGPFVHGATEGETVSVEFGGGEMAWVDVQVNNPIDGFIGRIKP